MLDREALIALLYEHIATPAEIERMKKVNQQGGKTRTLRAERGRVVKVHELADKIIDWATPTL